MGKTDRIKNEGRPLPLLKAIHPTTLRLTEVNFAEDVAVNSKTRSNLKTELRDLSRKFAWYLSIRDAAADELREAQYEEYCMEEDLYLQIKSQLEKTTETEIKIRVKAHPRMRQSYSRRMAAESLVKHAESVVQMVTEKRSSLQSLVKLEAAELGAQINEE